MSWPREDKSAIVLQGKRVAWVHLSVDPDTVDFEPQLQAWELGGVEHSCLEGGTLGQPLQNTQDISGG